MYGKRKQPVVKNEPEYGEEEYSSDEEYEEGEVARQYVDSEDEKDVLKN